MMSAILKGRKTLTRRLANIGRETQGDPLAAALLAGADVVAPEVANQAPRRSGDLASGIRTAIVKRGRTPVAVVGYDARTAFHGIFQELGTVNHPAQKHLATGLASKQSAALSTIKAKLGRGVDRARRS